MSDDGRDEWKRQLGTMWRMASAGLDTLRDVVVRSSQEGKLRVDLALYQRERRDLFGELGQAVVGLVDAGRLTLPEELQPIVARLRDVEERIRHDSARVHDNAFGAPRGYEPEAGAYDEQDTEGGTAEGSAGREDRMK
jgi:hypothetical protein